MNNHYQSIIENMKYSPYFETEYKYFDVERKLIADRIIEHNKKCEIDVSFNNREFWEDIIKNPNIDIGIHYLIITSPFAPQDIVEKTIQQTTTPTTLIDALNQDRTFSDKTYEHILKHSKKQMIITLQQHYSNSIKPLPFSQQTIEFYGKKFFDKNNIKNDKTLIFLSYIKDQNFLNHCFESPLLNEDRLNYLLNNNNIPDNIREKMFLGNNANGITPDYNAIRIATPFMVNEIYQTNVEGYFLCDKTDKKNKENIIGNIMDLIIYGLSTEGIEKDIINQYPTGDKTYERLLTKLLQNTKYIDVLKHAYQLDVSLFRYAFDNLNITDAFLQEYGPLYIDKILSHTKSKKRLQTHTDNIGPIIKKIQLKPEHYQALLKIKNPELTEYICVSPCTPINVLENISLSKENYLNDNIKMIAELNLEMRNNQFKNPDIYNWCIKILHNKIGYNLNYSVSYYGSLNFKGIDEDTMAVLSNPDNKFDAIMQKLFDKYHPKSIEQYFTAKSAYNIIQGIEPDNPSSKGYFLKKRYDLINAYNRQTKLLDKLNETTTLGYLYSIIDDCVDEWNSIDKRIDNIKRALEPYSRSL